MKKPLGLFSGFAAITLAATAFFGLGAYDHANAARKYDGCRKIDASTAFLEGRAEECRSAANSESDRLLSGIAAFNAARAYNNRGGAGDFAAALDQIAFSRNISNDEANYPGKDGKIAQQLRVARTIEAARSYIAIGSAAKRSDSCAAAQICSANLSNAEKEFVKIGQPAGPTDPNYFSYYYVHADMNQVLGRIGPAIADLTQIANEDPGAVDRLAKIYTSSITSALNVDPPQLDALQAASAAPPKVLENRPAVQVARGKALLKLASLDKGNPSNYYRSASDTFQTVINSNQATVPDKADGWLGKGEALLGLNEPGAGVQALKQSEALEANKPERMVGLGSAYARAGDISVGSTATTYWTTANGYFERAKQAAWTGTPSDRVSMLIKRADVKAKLLGRTAPDVIAAYQDAIRVDAGSPKPYYMVGAAYFQSTQYDSALTNLNLAINNARSRPHDISANDLAYAYHYRSLITAQRASSVAVTPANRAVWKSAVDDADTAADRGSEPIFASEACLIRIMRPTAFGDPSEGCRSNGSPESSLLQGMAYLKAARLMGPELKALNFGKAEGAFSTGLALLQGVKDTAAKFKTIKPGMYQEPPSIGVLLEFGKAAVPACYGARVTTSLSSAEITAAKSFFRSHDVRPCAFFEQ